jgi:hypothetical protein
MPVARQLGQRDRIVRRQRLVPFPAGQKDRIGAAARRQRSRPVGQRHTCGGRQRGDCEAKKLRRHGCSVYGRSVGGEDGRRGELGLEHLAPRQPAGAAFEQLDAGLSRSAAGDQRAGGRCRPGKR